MTALPLLTKIPALAKGIAGIFGKKLPETVTDAMNLAGEVTGMIQKGQVPPEQMVMMEAQVMEHKEEIMKIQNERLDIERQARKDQMDTTVAMWGQEIQSKDIYVSRTRPMILRRLFYACIAYAFITTLSVVILEHNAKETEEVISLIKWVGGSLFGTFSAAFLGYTTARTVDKRNPDLKNSAGIAAGLIKKLL